MIITKIKWDKGKMDITYSQFDCETDVRDISFCSYDDPLDSFKKALQRLAAHVEKICEFPKGYLSGPEDIEQAPGRVISVSFSYSAKDIMAATITVLRDLKGATSPLVINSPNLPEDQYSASGTQPILPFECVVALNHLKDEAVKYMAGERASKQEELALVA